MICVNPRLPFEGHGYGQLGSVPRSSTRYTCVPGTPFPRRSASDSNTAKLSVSLTFPFQLSAVPRVSARAVPLPSASVRDEELPCAVHERIVDDRPAATARARSPIVSRARRHPMNCEHAAKRPLAKIEEEDLAALAAVAHEVGVCIEDEEPVPAPAWRAEVPRDSRRDLHRCGCLAMEGMRRRGRQPERQRNHEGQGTSHVRESFRKDLEAPTMPRPDAVWQEEEVPAAWGFPLARRDEPFSREDGLTSRVVGRGVLPHLGRNAATGGRTCDR